MKWFRRFIYALLLTIWLAVMLFPLAAFKLARNGEFHVNNTRVFLVETNNEHGVGFHTTKPLRNAPACTQTNIRYLLWEGDSPATSNCICDDGSACP